MTLPEEDRLAELRAKANPPLTRAQVDQFEAECGVQLPSAFARFLTEVGNGGAFGPQYGVPALGDTWGSPWHDVPYGDAVSIPYGMPAECVWEDEPDERKREVLQARAGHGNIVIGYEGCGTYWVLIVAGPRKGEICLLTEVGIASCPKSVEYMTWLRLLCDEGLSWWSGLVRHWGPKENAFFLSHAPKKAVLLRPGREVTTSTPICEDCKTFIRLAAIHEGKQQIVRDPLVRWVFEPTGRIQAVAT